MNQTFDSAEGWYSLEYPRMWEMEVVENIPAFFDPIFGRGALQVFAARLGDAGSVQADVKAHPFLLGETLHEKMVIFLNNQGVNYTPENISTFEMNGQHSAALEYQLENRFYMVCMLQKGPIFVLSLYNCEDQPTEDEARTIGEIIRSIAIR